MKRNDESGMALVSALLIMMLMSALLVGFFAVIAADQQASGVTRDQTQAYAAAHAGLEKLTADLGALFVGGNFSPSAAQLNALTTAPPALPGSSSWRPDGGRATRSRRARPATAHDSQRAVPGPAGADHALRDQRHRAGQRRRARRRRRGADAPRGPDVAVPVFQFGVYSENDLSFFAGPDFDFGGRVHSNQNIYLAQDGSNTLTMRDVVTAVGEVVRTHLSNGLSIATSGHRGYVRLADHRRHATRRSAA